MLVSDLLVWVEHNSDLRSNGLWWEVLGECGSHETRVSVTGDNLSPDGFVVDTSGGILVSVDESDALSVVPLRGGTVIASLNLDKGSSLVLSSLSSLESNESSLGVKSITKNNRIRFCLA